MTPVREFTLRAVVAGVVLGIVFGAANAYLGLRVGLTISASIPAAVMTVAAFRALRLRPSILETNLSQTVGSASTALATGTIFTIPALFPWGMVPPYLQVVALCFLGGVLGLAAMIPLRKLLIVDSAAELPYPEGTACAEVLRATASDGGGSAWIFRGMALGAAIKLLVSLAFLVPSGLSAALPVLPKAELAIELAPALVGVGFILGYRQSAVIVAVARGLPTMVGAFAAVARGLRRSGVSTDRDLPAWFVFGAIAVVPLACFLVPGIFAGDMGALPRAVCALGVAVFGVLFVAVASRIVGLVGVSSQPTSGITLVTLLGVAGVFAAAGWTSGGARAAVLTVGTVVAIAASKAGDISQDLKTGYLVGATPARQQLGQLIGAACACWAVAATVLLLGRAWTFGSRDLPAPQAMLMKTIIEGVLAGALPWGLVLTGGGLAISAMLCGVSGLAFAIGVYLPLSSMAPIYVGGCVRAWVERRRSKASPGERQEGDSGILAASGLVAGEGLAGVLVAALVATGVATKSHAPRIPGAGGEIAALLLIAAVC